MSTFFQAWRRRQADRQAHEWEEEKDEARRAVQEAPPGIRPDLRRIVGTLIEGPDDAIQAAIDELGRLLETDPELKQRFFRLRIVDDAVEFLNTGS
jgi:hypothetical protein